MTAKPSLLTLASALAMLSLVATPSQAMADDPPEIVQFDAWTPGGNLWVIEGYVVDEDPVCFVDLSGIVYDASFTEADGYFQFVFHFPGGVFGTVEATAFDSLGQSGSASTLIVY